MSLNLLYKDKIEINDKISVIIPKVGDVISDEEKYYSIVSSFTCMPIDMAYQLDDCGIDFTTIDDYQLFLLLFNDIKKLDTHLILGDLRLANFVPAVNEKNDQIVLLDKINDIVIDKAIYHKIALSLRMIHNLEKNNRKPANEEAKKYIIDRARAKAKRRRKTQPSRLEPLIVSLVNTEQYKYDYDGTRELSIYQFNQSVKQIIKKIEYDNRMRGVYAGTLDVKSLSQDDLTWVTTK